MPSDIELLGIEIKTLWTTDDRGRLLRPAEVNGSPAPYLVIAGARGELIAAIGSDVPDALAGELVSVVARSPASLDARSPPAALARCQELIEGSLAPTEVTSGPSYLVPSRIVYTSSAKVHRSDGNAAALAERNPELAGWSGDEWRQLLLGDLGPWAMAMIAGEVVSICHTSRLGEQGAEAGVWTAPGFRGQGHATAVTAAWASLFEAGSRVLFYSTSAENLSSQRVAARLNLREVGWRWQVYGRDAI